MLVFLLLIPTSDSFAQGTLFIRNGTANLVINELTQAPVTTEDGILAALYHAPDGTVGDNVFAQISSPLLIGIPLPGTFQSGNITTPANTPPCGVALFQIRVWEGSYGATFEEAIQAGPQGGRLALVGKSSIMRLETGCNPLVPPKLYELGGMLPSFSMQPVPEPTTVWILALAAGLTWMFLVRARKKRMVIQP